MTAQKKCILMQKNLFFCAALYYTLPMKAKNTGRTYEEKVKDARESLAKWSQEREEQRKANPINWNEVVPNYYKK